MTEFATAAVVGLGLVGGSLARDLAAAGIAVAGYDRDPITLRAALDEGVIWHALEVNFAGVADADVVILAVPVGAACSVLQAARPHLEGARLITDTGSTKASIGAAATALGLANRFVGSHPFAGDHRSGWSASRRGLFRGSTVFLCPADPAAGPSLVLARELWRSVGAHTEILSAAAHDERLGWASHLPQSVSSALALALDARAIAPEGLGPGGRDATRLAGSEPRLWADVALDNADVLIAALEATEGQLAGLRTALAAGDHPAVYAFFAAGRRWAEGGGTEQ